jgi:hypothetical protein
MHVPNEMERVLEDTIDLNGFQLFEYNHEYEYRET